MLFAAMLYMPGYRRSLHTLPFFSAFLAVTATVLTVSASAQSGTVTLTDLTNGVVICQFGKIRNLVPDLFRERVSLIVVPSSV